MPLEARELARRRLWLRLLADPATDADRQGDDAEPHDEDDRDAA